MSRRGTLKRRPEGFRVFQYLFPWGSTCTLPFSPCCRPAAMPSGFGTSAPASWFQVNCPSCTAALQVRLAEGSWPVACSQALKCHAIFTVKVHAQMLKAPEALPVASKRHSVRVARAVNAYNLFIKIEAKRLRTLDRTLKAADAWTLAAAGWAASPMNPKNAPAGVTVTATAGAAAAAAAATAVPLGAQATAAAPTAAEAVTRPMDLDEDDELAIGVLQHLNARPVTTAAAVAAPGDGGRGRGRGWGRVRL